jgi:hypothetical protein
MQGFAEYAVGGIASPSTVPATLGSGGNWAAAALALNLATPPAPPVNLPPVIPQQLTFSFSSGGTTPVVGNLVGVEGSGIVYNIRGFNPTPGVSVYALSVCYIASENAIRISGFSDYQAGPNSTEILVSDYGSFLTNAQGWPSEPACAT